VPSADLVVRVSTNPDALARVATSVRVTRWLAGRGFPCVEPADVDGQPWVEGGRVVSVWRYVPATPTPMPGPPPSGTNLGRLLRALHSQPEPPAPPAPFADPLASVARALAEAPQALPAAERRWLADRIGRLRAAWDALEFPLQPGLIHGDAHPGNLLRTPEGRAVLGDWDYVATGPREWDLVQIHYTRRRFGQPSGSEVDGFTAAYGWDIRAWPGLATLVAVREVTGLSAYMRTAAAKPFSAAELTYRIGTLYRGDAEARWTPPTPE
jgi:aminoglycoside phosphotransferase (APT) family kinase protein